MLCAVALSSSISRTRISFPFPAAGPFFANFGPTQRLPESEADIEWLTKSNSALQELSDFSDSGHTVLNLKMNHGVRLSIPTSTNSSIRLLLLAFCPTPEPRIFYRALSPDTYD